MTPQMDPLRAKVILTSWDAAVWQWRYWQREVVKSDFLTSTHSDWVPATTNSAGFGQLPYGLVMPAMVGYGD